MTHMRTLVIGSLLCIGAGGCGAIQKTYDNGMAAAWVGSRVVDGQTTLAFVQERLGPPTATYENEKLIAYRLVASANAVTRLTEITFLPRLQLATASRRVAHADDLSDEQGHIDDYEWQLILSVDGQGVIRAHKLFYIWVLSKREY